MSLPCRRRLGGRADNENVMESAGGLADTPGRRDAHTTHISDAISSKTELKWRPTVMVCGREKVVGWVSQFRQSHDSTPALPGSSETPSCTMGQPYGLVWDGTRLCTRSTHATHHTPSRPNSPAASCSQQAQPGRCCPALLTRITSILSGPTFLRGAKKDGDPHVSRKRRLSEPRHVGKRPTLVRRRG